MTWMTTIVRNRSLDLLRRPAMEAPTDLEAIMEVRMDDNPGPFERALMSADAANLARCLKTLEARQLKASCSHFSTGLRIRNWPPTCSNRWAPSRPGSGAACSS